MNSACDTVNENFPKGIAGAFCLGDNLDWLQRLQTRFAGSVALALLDPPYNARNRKKYPDDFDHEEWLAFMRARIEATLPLLKENGVLAVHIDDTEQAWLQVLLDQILGRERRINTVCVKMSELSGVKMRYQERMLPRTKEYLLLYGKSSAAQLYPIQNPKPPEKLTSYLRYYRQFLCNPNDPIEQWKIVPLKQILSERHIPKADMERFQQSHADQCVYRTNNRMFDQLPPEARPQSPLARVRSPWGEEYIWWEGKQLLRLSDHLHEPLSDIWADISTINLGKEGGYAFPSGKKPEMLIERILALTTQVGDLVLDPFCGSGTTPAVAVRMERHFLSIECDPKTLHHAHVRLDAECTQMSVGYHRWHSPSDVMEMPQ